MMSFKSISTIVFILLNIAHHIQCKATVLDSTNFDSLLEKNEVVMINFYADWCRFSQMLAPIWDELAEKVQNKPELNGKVIIGKVDSDKEQGLASRFHISKYPTLKLLHNGQAVKKEYRGQRTADAMLQYVQQQLESPIQVINSLDIIDEARKEKKRTMFGYFEAASGTLHDNFNKVASTLKDDCKFFSGVGEPVRAMRPPQQDLVTFAGHGPDEDDTFAGDTASYQELLAWATDRCIPLVREITFANAEELTEEGLPFLILFRKSDDKDSPARYRAVIERELRDDKGRVNFLEADGEQFSHPLHHLGKSVKDLPIIAIDSFRHMYLFKDFNAIDKPGTLKRFLADLYSGKLHLEFHYGPQDDPDESEEQEVVTAPPESTFKKLGPSPNRYTLLDKEEL